jgi:hypothetical protein
MVHMKFLATFFVAAFSLSAASAETLPPLKPGEAIAIMPDGKVTRGMIADPDHLKILKENSEYKTDCSMLIADERGLVSEVKTVRHEPMVICENLFAP